MLAAAARFHEYSFGNVMLILAQNPDATRVAGYRTWQSLGRRVRKGERGIRILARITYRSSREDGGHGPDEQDRPRELRGFRVEHVWDISSTDGDPYPDVAIALLEGEGPVGLWEALGEQVVADGYQLERGPCARPQAKGETDPATRTVTVRDDLSTAQAAKTLVHERAHPARPRRQRGQLPGVQGPVRGRGGVRRVPGLRGARHRRRELLPPVRRAVGER
jgi:hypothetical protein